MKTKKKVVERINTFYRGPVTGPSHVSDENETQTILRAIDDCIPQKDYAFRVQFYGARQIFKLVIGLSACLRFIKRKRTAAILYDESLSPHLVKYLNEFARNLDIHSIQVPGLTQQAPKYNFKSLLAVSIITLPDCDKDIASNDSSHQPITIKGIVESDAFTKLCQFLGLADLPVVKDVEFKPPSIDKVPVKGKKKNKRKKKKKNDDNKTEPAIEEKQS